MVKAKPRLAIVTTHPIQYHAPLFRLLAQRERVLVKIFYTWSQAEKEVFDPGFGKHRSWDIPMLDGYEFTFVTNTAKKPGSHHFWGIQNPDLCGEIARWQPDAVMVFGWSFQSHLQVLRYFKNKVPVFFRGDSTLLDERQGVKTWLRRIALKWVYQFVDKAFYVGENNRQYYLKHGLKPSQLIPAYHAIENERFSEPEAKVKAADFRVSLHLDPGDFLVLFAGKLEKKKKPAFLLKLAGAIEDRDIKFVFVGNGSLEAELKAAAGNDSRFKWVDFRNQSEMPAVYHAADCFILPSTGPGETWGLAANEAMACGLPVLLSDKVGGAVDLVKGNGIIFQCDDVKSAASYIIALKNSYHLRQEAGSNSLKRIKEFSMVAIAISVENAMAAVLEAKTKITLTAAIPSW